MTQDSQQVAVALDGSFAVVWLDTFGDISPFIPIVAGRFFDPSGRPRGGDQYPSNLVGGQPFVVPYPPAGFGVFWGSATEDSQRSELRLKTYSQDGLVVGKTVAYPPPDPSMLITNVVSTAAGRLVLSWITNQDSPAYDVKATKLGQRGQQLWQEVVIARDPQNALFVGDVGVDRQGNAVVTWAGDCGPPGAGLCDVFAQRVSFQGEQLGDRILVNTRTKGLQEHARVAVAPDGGFLVVWDSGPVGPGPVDIFAQRFTGSGARLGRPFKVSSQTGFFQAYPEVAADPLGNYFVAWPILQPEEGLFGWNIRGQLFRSDGRRVGRELKVNSRNTFNELPTPRVAFGGNGTFVVVWNANDFDFDGVYAQRFAASPADEPCVVRGGRLLCDTGRTGADPEIDLTFGGRPGETLMLGDFDGDGREDLCARYGVRFRCDLDHRGAPAEGPKVSFGLPDDIPLMGDFDGDGRADFCVRRGDQFLCDTGHNGGEAEARVTFGRSTEMPLLGDVDGDGRDDACLWSEAGFLCDTAHDGGAAEVQLAFGAPGDLPLLGDFDGDGDDDPCVWRAGRFLCDTAHDGGAPEAELAFGQVGDRPLLGNLDGL